MKGCGYNARWCSGPVVLWPIVESISPSPPGHLPGNNIPSKGASDNAIGCTFLSNTWWIRSRVVHCRLHFRILLLPRNPVTLSSRDHYDASHHHLPRSHHHPLYHYSQAPMSKRKLAEAVAAPPAKKRELTPASLPLAEIQSTPSSPATRPPAHSTTPYLPLSTSSTWTHSRVTLRLTQSRSSYMILTVPSLCLALAASFQRAATIGSGGMKPCLRD